MVSPATLSLPVADETLNYENACRIAERVGRWQSDGLVVIDLSLAAQATTGAFARLIQLRGDLLRAGRDLRLAGLRDRALSLHGVFRLGRLLPLDGN